MCMVPQRILGVRHHDHHFIDVTATLCGLLSCAGFGLNGVGFGPTSVGFGFTSVTFSLFCGPSCFICRDRHFFLQ